MALTAIRRFVTSLEGETRMGVLRVLPCGCRVPVAVVALGGEPLLLMVGLLILGEVAVHTIRG